jgi:hypothetical protein
MHHLRYSEHANVSSFAYYNYNGGGGMRIGGLQMSYIFCTMARGWVDVTMRSRSSSLHFDTDSSC